MKLRIVYAVRCTWGERTAEGDKRSYVNFLEDTCAFGSWTDYSESAKTWASREELLGELAATDIGNPTSWNGPALEIVELVEFQR